ncbi:plexin-B2-like [Mytilus californianus]|uniref:plexin-B2-like n=1 Tax=Mytilus californianus TaxID=6549 RepID=UPI0022452042|nr:plexin-B2-like [Mytilus californianus]
MVFISLLFMIETVIIIELRCIYSKPVYRNNDEKFRNIAVTSDYVYIGGNSKILQLNSSLIQSDQKYVSVDGVTSIYSENWLLATHNNDSLIVCNFNSNNDILCLKFEKDLSVVTYDRSLKSNKPAPKYLTTTAKQTNILIIGSSTCLWHDIKYSKCNAISSYSLDNFLVRFQPGRREYDVEYLQNAKHVTFRAILKIEKFIYFLFNTEERHSKLGKMCTSNTESEFTVSNVNSFEDTPIVCSRDGKIYTMAQDAVHWKEYLFVVFSDDSSNVICKYKLRNIAKTFMESRQKRLECPYYNTANTYFVKQALTDWCFNRTTGQCQGNSLNISCPETTDKTDGFCKTQFFGSVEGALPSTEDEIVYSEEILQVGAIVKLGVLGFNTHSLIFAGTTTGKIGKIYVDERKNEQLGIFQIVQHSFPVLDIKVHNQNVYVMTENTVINIADNEPCPSNVLCFECMKSENPTCGWDIVSARCMVNADHTTWWLPSVGRQCLQVKAKKLVINETTDNVRTS